MVKGSELCPEVCLEEWGWGLMTNSKEQMPHVGGIKLFWGRSSLYLQEINFRSIKQSLEME